MGLINFFSINFFFINSSIFFRLNSIKSLFLYPYNLIFFAITRPFATAKDILIPEKLPGPWLTIMLNLSSNITLCDFKKL